MRRASLVLLFGWFTLISHCQIIADHTVVEKFNKIPPSYIEKVKKMLVVIAGESHSWGYIDGMLLLEQSHTAYSVDFDGVDEPEGYTEKRLRIEKSTWGDLGNSSGWIRSYGEEDWFTSKEALSRTKAGIAYMNTHGWEISAIGFAWCYDAVGNLSSLPDPVYGVRWNGISFGGPEGNKPWGLDADDYALTGNSVNMDTYLKATQEYIDFCKANGYQTKVFFTTGTVDEYVGEAGYQGHLKYEHIRNYVRQNPSLILFDYADILCYDNDGTLATETWRGHIYPGITMTNQKPITPGHISNTGKIRLGKAMWWMLARIAGWNGN